MGEIGIGLNPESSNRTFFVEIDVVSDVYNIDCSEGDFCFSGYDFGEHAISWGTSTLGKQGSDKHIYKYTIDVENSGTGSDILINIEYFNQEFTYDGLEYNGSIENSLKAFCGNMKELTSRLPLHIVVASYYDYPEASQTDAYFEFPDDHNYDVVFGMSWPFHEDERCPPFSNMFPTAIVFVGTVAKYIDEVTEYIDKNLSIDYTLYNLSLDRMLSFVFAHELSHELCVFPDETRNVSDGFGGSFHDHKKSCVMNPLNSSVIKRGLMRRESGGDDIPLHEFTIGDDHCLSYDAQIDEKLFPFHLCANHRNEACPIDSLELYWGTP